MSDLLTRGVAAGLFAGFAFLLANMWYALSQDNPPVGPLQVISTVFHGSDAPDPSPANALVGLVMHTALSMAFGMGFAVLMLLVPMLMRTWPLLIGAALVYGLALYVVNFQILGRTAYPFFTDPAGPNQVLELLVHPLVFGLFLVPFFLRSPGSPIRPGPGA
ncbi:hypothetical protein [Streptomyces sp. YIM 98790]|uniref:hypothetical protein n=1 Tax=Streptomyces sp. YIM 98790 TaxID=2689077 RepID=UPI0014073872|nr:hypothetical protein [Streptomyces sp. YIM 98790]